MIMFLNLAVILGDFMLLMFLVVIIASVPVPLMSAIHVVDHHWLWNVGEVCSAVFPYILNVQCH